MTKPLICVYMGQGAVASLEQYNFYSNEFSSCCPLVMFNPTTKMAGFYHVPGKTIRNVPTMIALNDDDWKTVKPMAEMVQPTRVVIFPGNSVTGVYAARDPMQKAFNATNLACLSNMRTSKWDEGADSRNRLKMPEEKSKKVSLAVELDGGKLKFTKDKPAFTVDQWFDSKRNLEKKPTVERDGISFWGWEVNVRGFRELSSF
jgi:hypothetical protein